MPYKDQRRNRAANAAWMVKNADKRRAQRDRKRYGTSREDMIELLGNDDCAICGFNGGRFRNAIDHCAETGLVRGFLCRPCNTGLGLFNHQTHRLRKAAEYMEAPQLVPPDRYQRMLRVARQDTPSSSTGSARRL